MYTYKPLETDVSKLPIFVAGLRLKHRIDPKSPIFGLKSQLDAERMGILAFHALIEGTEEVSPRATAPTHDHTWHPSWPPGRDRTTATRRHRQHHRSQVVATPPRTATPPTPSSLCSVYALCLSRERAPRFALVRAAGLWQADLREACVQDRQYPL